MPQTRYVRTSDRVDLAYRIFEGGPADLVFVQAFVSAMEAFSEWPGTRRLLHGLSTFARVVEYDGRGTGLSGRTGHPPVLESRVEDLGAVMDVAGLDRAAIFAMSDGAAVAALFAATHPERVSALALFNPIVRTAWAEDYPWGVRPEDQDEFQAHIWDLWHAEDPTLEQIESFSGDVGEAGDDPAFRRWFSRSLRYLTSPAEFEAYDRIWMDTDVRHVLGSIQAPTVVLHAPEGADELGLNAAIAAAIPGATARELPGVFFIPMIGNIDAIVDAVAEHLRVDRPVPATDRVLASVLFTDIVDSTRRAAELGDANWKDLLAQHDEIERDRLERFGGRFVHTTGDGMLATFDGPARAVHCAQAIAEAVRPLGVEIRAGVHTGEVELLRGEVQGLAVHIGARVAAKAAPSEVWVSRTVKDLVAGSGLAFEDAGEHELKGVPDRWHLYRVVD